MEKINQLFNEWQQLQPLKPEDQKRLDDKFNLEFNYNSNHIEGNTLTYGQTKLLLLFGEATGDAKMRDLEEMKAHNAGLKWIRERAKEKEYILTERDIRDLNRIILAEDYYKLNTQTGTRYKINVGVYKTRPNSVITVTGETFDYASPEETSALMYELIKWFNEEIESNELSPVELASLLHYRYIRIHPFEDGNGRIARLLVTYVLERLGYPMVIIKSKNKEEYLRVLHQCDINAGLTPSEGANASPEEIAPFVEYMKRQLEWSFSICIKAAKGESIEEEDDFSKRINLLEQEARQQYVGKKQNIQSRADKTLSVLSSLYLSLRNNVVKSLKSASSTFYTQEWDETYFSKNVEKKNALKIEEIEEWINNANAGSRKMELLSDVKSIYYTYVLRSPKQEYEILPGALSIGFCIMLEEEYYTISTLGNKQFSYGIYPSEEEVEKIISTYKMDVLTKIEKSVHGAK